MSTTEDVVAIQQLVALNGHLLDMAQWDRLGEFYADDAIVVSPKNGRHEGLEAIRAYLISTSGTVHHSTNCYVSVEEGADEATGVTKLLGIYPDGRVITGTYHDTWKRTSAGWRLWRRTSEILADELPSD